MSNRILLLPERETPEERPQQGAYFLLLEDDGSLTLRDSDGGETTFAKKVLAVSTDFQAESGRSYIAEGGSVTATDPDTGFYEVFLASGTLTLGEEEYAVVGSLYRRYYNPADGLWKTFELLASSDFANPITISSSVTADSFFYGATDVQVVPESKSTSFTPRLGRSYVSTATITVTDPSPAEGSGYEVTVRNGTTTIGGVTYATPGTIVRRIYHSGAWASYHYLPS